MPDVLLILHFIGLMLGISGSLGGAMTLGFARPNQKQKGGSLRGIGPAFAHLSTFGLLLLWPTGIALLVVSKGEGLTDPMFLMKGLFTLLLTFATLSTEMIYARAKSLPQLPPLLVSLGPLAVLSYLMVTVFSVLALH